MEINPKEKLENSQNTLQILALTTYGIQWISDNIRKDYVPHDTKAFHIVALRNNTVIGSRVSAEIMFSASF